jgi:hypothetical protein
MAKRMTQKADVANVAVRNILGEVSLSLFDDVNNEYLKKAAEFFHYKCPYTGDDIKDEILRWDLSNLNMDHIIPLNRDNVGLNVRGNTVLVRKKANSSKSSKSYIEFLIKYGKENGIDDDIIEERIKRIEEFQTEFGFNYDLISDIIKTDVQEFYAKVIENQKTLARKIISKVNKETMKVKGGIDLTDYIDYLELSMTKDTAYDYAAALRRLLINEGITLKELNSGKVKIIEVIDIYKKGGSKSSESNSSKMVSSLKKYAEFKGISLVVTKTSKGKSTSKSKKSTAKVKDFKEYLTIAKKKNGANIDAKTQNAYYNGVEKALSIEGLKIEDEITESTLKSIIDDYRAKGSKKSSDPSGVISAGLGKYKEYINSKK